MKNVKIFEIEFNNSKESFETENYPNSGLFKVIDKEANFIYIRFVNKIDDFTLGIASLEVFSKCCDNIEPEYKFDSSEKIQN